MSQPTAPQHRDLLSLAPILAGLWWLLAGSGFGWFCWSLLPGVLLLASGLSVLLWAGDGKHTHFMALGAVLGVLFTIPAAWCSMGAALVALALSIASFLVAGRIALRAFPEMPGAPPAPMEARIYAKAAVDEALLGYFLVSARVPGGDEAARMCKEAAELESVLRGQGWLDRPESFHRTPPPPEDVRLSDDRAAGFSYQRLKFSSGFTPEGKLPGLADWAGYLRNRECRAAMFRQDEPGRPWLLCIHGYRMGFPLADFRLFDPRILHRRYGLNLLLPVLPLHGPRRAGWQSGDYYLEGDISGLLHAQTQALWDLRRSIAWIRAQDPQARIGVLGYSLGGYNASLLAAYEPGLDFVVAGIPVADFAPLLWRHLPGPHQRYYIAQGLTLERYGELLRVISPLARAPQLPAERLHIFAGTADCVVPPDQPLRLSRHWNRPAEWYPGGHLTFRGERSVERCIAGAMTGAGWRIDSVA
ncbi:MAG TPA: hypothetical protein VNX47_04365 [Nevskia sp.]|jgi:dienelactone hydrolase|nr:hypothetical protein [Nevskia sp.]